MLEISDVVETHYVKNEKMIDIHHAPKQKQPDLMDQNAGAEPPSQDVAVGFEDYLDSKPQAKSAQEGAVEAEVSGNSTPGFEDYLDQQHQEIQKATSTSAPSCPDSPGFEDYLEE